MLSVCLLGSFEALRDGQPVPYSAWGRRKTLALAKLLIAHRGVVFPHEELLGLLYEECPAGGAVSNLYRRISELRRALEPHLRDGRRSEFVRQQGQTYVFRRDAPCEVDVEQFLEAVAAARGRQRERETAAAQRHFQDAANLYRGDFLEEDRYLEWTQAPRARLRETYLEALSQLATCHAEAGAYEQAIDACGRVLDAEPYREPVIRQLMEYYAAVGDRSQAIAVYNAGIRALAETLNVQPEAETTQLFKRISRRSDAAARQRLDRRRIAVLPFTHAGGASGDRLFAEGLAEQVARVLSNVQQFQVVSSSSAARHAQDGAFLARIGRDLRVGTVVEGSVQVSGKRVQVSASLSDVETEERIWSETYDRERAELLALQSQIAESIAEALRQRLGEHALPPLPETQTRSWEAYELYLIGRHHWNRRCPEGYQAAAESFQRSIACDPNYSAAHAGLAAALCDLGESSRVPGLRDSCSASAESEAKRALELDPRCAEARATLGRNRMYFGRDPVGAEREIREAIRLNPSYAMACNWLGVLLVGLARFDEAADILHRAHRLDPLSLAVLRNLGRAYYNARRYDEAIGELRKAIGLDPRFAELHLLLGLVYLELARPEEAIVEFEQERLLNARCVAGCDALIRIAQARQGATDRLLDFARELRLDSPNRASSSELIWVAAALLEAGQEQRARACLGDALDSSLGWFMLYIHTPLLDAASPTGWYVSLLRRAHLVSS